MSLEDIKRRVYAYERIRSDISKLIAYAEACNAYFDQMDEGASQAFMDRIARVKAARAALEPKQTDPR